jgi:hypothetical protein
MQIPIFFSCFGTEDIYDYVRTIVFGPVIPPLSHFLLYVLSAATLGGLFLMIYNDVGIAKTVQTLWRIPPYQKKEE